MGCQKAVQKRSYYVVILMFVVLYVMYVSVIGVNVIWLPVFLLFISYLYYSNSYYYSISNSYFPVRLSYLTIFRLFYGWRRRSYIVVAVVDMDMQIHLLSMLWLLSLLMLVRLLYLLIHHHLMVLLSVWLLWFQLLRHEVSMLPTTHRKTIVKANAMWQTIISGIFRFFY